MAKIKWIISRDYIGEICGRLTTGQPLASICKLEHLPSISTVLRWLATEAPGPDDQSRETGENLYSILRTEYGRARTASADVGLEQIQEIERRMLLPARIPNLDWDPGLGRAPDNPKFTADPQYVDPSTAKVLIDSIKWRMGKMQPAKYGEKMHLQHGGSIDMNTAKDLAPDWLKNLLPVLAGMASAGAAPAQPAAPQQAGEDDTVH